MSLAVAVRPRVGILVGRRRCHRGGRVGVDLDPSIGSVEEAGTLEVALSYSLTTRLRQPLARRTGSLGAVGAALRPRGTADHSPRPRL